MEVIEQIGEQGLSDLVAAFYRIMKTDDLVGPMYPDDDWQGSEERLRDFLIFRFGGSDKYIQERGHPRLRMRHMGFTVDEAARDRRIKIMDQAIIEVEIGSPSREILQDFFKQTADFMRNCPG